MRLLMVSSHRLGGLTYGLCNIHYTNMIIEYLVV
jgi:hypothetical protein